MAILATNIYHIFLSISTELSLPSAYVSAFTALLRPLQSPKRLPRSSLLLMEPGIYGTVDSSSPITPHQHTLGSHRQWALSLEE